jgi:ubiquitin C-terminal hydrolase
VASAKGFMQHIKKLGKDFAIGRQEDSHEFLVQLLDAVETIMLRERGSWADLDARSKVCRPCEEVMAITCS